MAEPPSDAEPAPGPRVLSPTPPPPAQPAPDAAAAPARDPALTRSLAAAIATISVTGFAIAMSYPLFSILLQRMGASGLEIGLNAAAPSVAMLLIAPFLPSWLRRVSLPALLTGAALLLAACFLAYKPLEGVWTWMALRFVMGVAGVVAFWGSELWIVSVAPPHRRGLMIGIYGLCLSLGFVAGPSVLQVMDVNGNGPFLAGAVLALLAIGPVLWAWRAAPRDLGGPPQPFFGAFRFFRTDPSVMFGVVLFGAVEFGGFALFPTWALGVGLPESTAIAAVAWVAFGNVLLQLPLGWAADRFSRKGILAVAAAACVAGPLALTSASDGGWTLVVVLTVVGGLSVALYSVGLAELGHRYQGEALARGTGAFLSAYGLGALAAPPLFGLAMDLAPPHGLMWAMAAMAAAYLALMAARAAAGGRREP